MTATMVQEWERSSTSTVSLHTSLRLHRYIIIIISPLLLPAPGPLQSSQSPTTPAHSTAQHSTLPLPFPRDATRAQHSQAHRQACRVRAASINQPSVRTIRHQQAARQSVRHTLLLLLLLLALLHLSLAERAPPPDRRRHGSEEQIVRAAVPRRGDAAGGRDGGGRVRRHRRGPRRVHGQAGRPGDVPDVRAGRGSGAGADAGLLRGAQVGAADQPQVPVRARQGQGRPPARAQHQRHQGARPPRRVQDARQHLRLPEAAEPSAQLQGGAGLRAVREAGRGARRRPSCNRWREHAERGGRAKERSCCGCCRPCCDSAAVVGSGQGWRRRRTRCRCGGALRGRPTRRAFPRAARIDGHVEKWCVSIRRR